MTINSISEIIHYYKKQKKHRIVLVGKAASGKDFARKIIHDLGYKYQPQFTTRPQREGEVHSIDYFFTYKEKFIDLLNLEFFYNFQIYNDWYYGISKYQFDSLDSLFIMTPRALNDMSTYDRTQSLVVYFDIDEDIRKQRLMLRNDADSVERRFKADASDFSYFKNYDLLITNPNFTLNYDL